MDEANRHISIDSFSLHYGDTDYDGVEFLRDRLDAEKRKALFAEAKAKGYTNFEDPSRRKKYTLICHENRSVLSERDEYTIVERKDETHGLGILGI